MSQRLNLESFIISFFINFILFFFIIENIFKVIDKFPQYEAYLTLLLFMVFGLYISLLVMNIIRRLNDVDGVKTSYEGILWVNIRMLLPGNKKKNKHGMPPKSGITLKSFFGF